MTLKKLTMTGFSHIAALAFVVVGVGGIGTYMLVASHADSTEINCRARSVKYAGKYREYNCSFWKTTPVVNHAGHTIGTNHKGTNWVLCQVGGSIKRSGSFYNNWWAYTVSDDGHWGWVNGIYGSGGSNTSSAPDYAQGSFSGVPQCYLYDEYKTSLHSFASAAPGTVLPGNYGK